MLDVSTIHRYVIVAMETAQVLGECAGRSQPDVITTVIKALQQTRIDGVKTILIQVLTSTGQQLREDATGQQASVRQVIIECRL